MKKILLTGLVCTFILGFSNITAISADDTSAAKSTGDKSSVGKADKSSSVKTSAAKTSVSSESDDVSNASASVNSAEIKNAIEAYKNGDYLACISILKEYTQKDSKNAVAWYYLGSAYMNIAMKREASAAFDKVIAISPTPKLTSYAIQAELCMRNPVDCKYENFNAAEVKKLKENPTQFINDYEEAKRKSAIKSDDVIQIENLIKGSYTNNIHPQAQDFILSERAKIKASQINSGKN